MVFRKDYRSVFEHLFGLLDRGSAQFAVHFAGTVQKLLQVAKGPFRCIKRLATASILPVRKIFRECRATPADAQTPALESRRFVCETSEVLFRFHGVVGVGFQPLGYHTVPTISTLH